MRGAAEVARMLQQAASGNQSIGQQKASKSQVGVGLLAEVKI